VAVEPDILLVDEVLAVGDEQFQRRCAEKMSELRSGGRTVVLVSHALTQVQQLCDHAVWLDKGSVRAAGPTEAVVGSYLASVTTAFRLDSKGRQRLGSGEIELEVEVITPDGPGAPISARTPVTIRFQWQTAQRLTDLTFGFTIRSADGYVITGSGSALDTRWRTLGPGSGSIDFVIPKLRLLPGSYHIAAAIMDRTTQHVYDHSPHIAQFVVTSSPGDEELLGVVTLDGEWLVTPGRW
jgi:hypothetical protein